MSKKILQIITLSEWGGAQRVCFDLAINLNKEKFQVEVACKSKGILIKKLKEKKIKVYEVPYFQREISLINDIKTFFSLYRIIKKGHYSIVHCHSTKAGILGRIAAKLAGVKKIYFTVHGWGFYNQEEYDWAQKLLIFLERIAAKCSTKIICVSENDKKEGIKRKIAKEDKFLVIKNGIRWEIKGSREGARKKLKIRENELIFGMVGRFAYPKNPILFLKAAKEMIKNYSRTKFTLIGGGPLLKECQNFVKENKLENNIFLLGKKIPEETWEILLGFDIFVLASKFEGLPLTIIEAMFTGLPVIATNVGGVNELVKNNKNGFLIKPNSIKELIQKMIYFIEHSIERKKMGGNGQKIAKENFTLDKMVESYEKLYENF